MGNPRPQPPLLLPEKLGLIRKHLNASETEMQKMLNLPRARHVSEYENARRRPRLLVALAYSRLGRVPMDSLVDDDVSIDAFRRELGTYDFKQPEKGAKKAAQGK